MVTTKFYLDARRATGATHSLRINITYRRKIASFPLGIQLASNQWDVASATIKNHPEAKFLNTLISKRKSELDTLILKLEEFEKERIAEMTATEIRDYAVSVLNPDNEKPKENKPKEDPNTFLKWYDRFTERKSGRTKAIYEATRRRLVAWLKNEEALAKVKFEDIKRVWLEDFEDFLSQTAGANANAIHFRNIRTVVNYAIDNEITTYYAFRRFKIKTEKTRKRNFKVDTLRRIFSHTCKEEWQQKYLDFFKLSFMLIGINVVDLCGLKKTSQGRVEYLRAKTHRPYSIKVEKEARELIERYAGKELLVNFAENYANYRHFYNNLCKGLNEVKEQLELEELTTYWARHSWATIALKLGVSKDTIALALGHGDNDVTGIYLEYEMQEVDEANRKVLDWVLYGKKDGVVVDPAFKAAATVAEKKPKRGRPRKIA